MDHLLDTAPCGYFSLSDTGIFRSANQTFLSMLTMERLALLGRHIDSVMSIANKLFMHTYFFPYIQLYGEVNEMYVSFRTADGLDVPVLLNGARRQRDGEVAIDCVALPMRKRIEHEKDVLQTKVKLEELYQATREANQKLELLNEEYAVKQRKLEELNEKLELLATTDPLTGLRNRRYFQDSLSARLAAYWEEGTPFSLLILDIDHFKKVNDTYGHPVGDLVLSGMARLLQSLSEENDIVARFGGEEFVVLINEGGKERAMSRAEIYRSAAEAASWETFRVTISIGAASAVSEDSELTLLNKADSALYASKSGGRNQVTYSE
ncbi:sensor domain-containing diguanylate cyclase [Paenibacillus sp. NPDC058071]|uniref:sensor domain-containing diguanylate cyclase n=1 Tax=Paenibacillus sp. NPDC058071 TaxID=3346326 RepID=UPI0036DC7484